MQKKALWIGMLLTALTSLPGGAGAAMFVFELKDGSRIVTDHPINDPNARLIRRAGAAEGVGYLLAHRAIEIPTRDPASFDSLIRHAAVAHDVDASLVKAVVHAESGFNPNAISRVGASGLMQLMPATAKRYGVHDIFDPAQNVAGGVRYLRDLLRMFKNDTRLAVAAYNAGEGAVLRYRGVPPYEETRDYVTKVLQFRNRYRRATVAQSSGGRVQVAQVATGRDR
jgi:soluble lytic murein transglycosylase-like protein